MGLHCHRNHFINWSATPPLYSDMHLCPLLSQFASGKPSRNKVGGCQRYRETETGIMNTVVEQQNLLRFIYLKGITHAREYNYTFFRLLALWPSGSSSPKVTGSAPILDGKRRLLQVESGLRHVSRWIQRKPRTRKAQRLSIIPTEMPLRREGC